MTFVRGSLSNVAASTARRRGWAAIPWAARARPCRAARESRREARGLEVPAQLIRLLSSLEAISAHQRCAPKVDNRSDRTIISAESLVGGFEMVASWADVFGCSRAACASRVLRDPRERNESFPRRIAMRTILTTVGVCLALTAGFFGGGTRRNSGASKEGKGARVCQIILDGGQPAPGGQRTKREEG